MRTYADISGVEIFSSGSHNGDTYTDKDLDAIVEAYGSLDFKPPLKAGHSKDKPGMPALGWVDNVRRNGGKLIADFKQIPELLYSAIKDGRYNTVSSEIYWNLTRGGKKYPRALKAVALLGADIPAVAGLRPLGDLVETFDSTNEEVHAYSMQFTADGNARHNSPSSDQSGATTMSDKDKQDVFTPEQLTAVQDMVKNSLEGQRKEYEEKAAATAAAHKAELEAAKKDVEDRIADAVKKFSKGEKVDDAVSRAIVNVVASEKDAEIRNHAARAETAQQVAEVERKARLQAEETAKAEREKSYALEKELRDIRIGKLADSCRIPAFRAFITQYMDLATRQTADGTPVKVYSEDGRTQIDATQAVSDLIKMINSQTNNVLFKVFSNDDGKDVVNKDLTDQDAINNEVDRLAKKYMAEHPDVKDYSKAMSTVLENNPALKQRYSVRYDAA